MVSHELKQRVLHETRRLLVYTVFFTLFFWAFATYRRLILGHYNISYIHYGYSLVEALILSKIIILGQILGIGERFENKPLIIPTLYKTFIFSIFVMAFDALEHFVIGAIHHQAFEKLYAEFMDKGIDLLRARILVMLFVFILFFAFLEIDRYMGNNKLVNLFLYGKKNGDRDLRSKIDQGLK